MFEAKKAKAAGPYRSMPATPREMSVGTKMQAAADQSVLKEARDEKAQAAALSLAGVKVSGGHDRAAVTTVIESRLGELVNCSGIGALKGKLVVQITVDAQGAVTGVKVVSGLSMLNWTGKRCVERAINAWRFAASPDGKGSVVTVTLEQAR